MFCQFHLILLYLALQIDLSLSLKLFVIISYLFFLWETNETHMRQCCVLNKIRGSFWRRTKIWGGESVEEQGSASCCSAVCLKCLSHFTCIFNKSVCFYPHMWNDLLSWACIDQHTILERDWWNTFGWLCSSFPEVSLSDSLLKLVLHPPIFWQNTVCFV